METLSQTATLHSISPETPGVQTLRIDLPLKFKPGQAIQISFPGDSKKRFYSISSSPTEGPYIEITVKSETGSALEKALLALKRGDTLEIAGPGGSLSVPDPLQGPLAFISAGTGVTPFRSMIRYLLDESSSTAAWLFHSVRSQNDLLFFEEFTTWSQKNPQFRYVPTITRDFDNNWKNETGRISDALVKKHVADHPCTYLLCGPTGFVSDIEQMLQIKLGVTPDKIRREKW